MMTNENDTDPLTAPPPREETDPNYAGRTGDRVSYGSVSHSGSEAHLQTDPNFLTALKEVPAPPPPPPPAAVVVIAQAGKASPGKNDSIDELIDGLPLDAALPKKAASAALPKAAAPSAPLPPVIVDVKTEPPALRKKGRVDNSTVVTPAGLELKTQRWVTLAVAVAIGLGLLMWAINWSNGPARQMQEPKITTIEAQHPAVKPAPAIAVTAAAPPSLTVPAVLENAPSESATLMHAPPTTSVASPTSASARSPHVPPAASANPDIDDFKPSIRH